MTNHIIDNSCQNLGKVVIWQYDKAYHLLLVLKMLSDLYKSCVADFWSYWNTSCLAIDTCSDFGAMIWGILIGKSRPIIRITIDGVEVVQSISTRMYRKLLKAELLFQCSNGSLPDIAKYTSFLFDTPDGNCGVKIEDNYDMSISFGRSQFYNDMDEEQQALFEQCKDDVLHYPLGIKDNEVAPEFVFGFSGQENVDSEYRYGVDYHIGDIVSYIDDNGHACNYVCLEDIPSADNVGFDSISDRLEKTFAGDKFVGGVSLSYSINNTRGNILENTYTTDGYVGWARLFCVDYKPDTSYSICMLIRYDNTIWIVVRPIQFYSNTSFDSIRGNLKEFTGSYSLFPEEYKEGNWIRGYVTHNGECYSLKADSSPISPDENTSWESVQPKMFLTDKWVGTTFICFHSLNKSKKSLFGHLFFNNGSLNTKLYNGTRDVTVGLTDLIKAFTAGSAIDVRNGNTISVNLDKMAEAEGKTIHTTATIGDIARYLGLTL